jgi:TetR/AcrR family transcriptional regulator, transcriptional repressor for nem operon
MARPATDKRQRLVTAAIEQFHSKGYTRTSLADVAKAAGLSAGNVFYYFKAKDELAQAVIEEWCALLTRYLAELESEEDAWQRIAGFIRQAALMRDIYESLGCPLAGITRDLRQESQRLKDEVARIYDTQFQWLTKEFHRGGATQKDALTFSRTLMAGYHGAILLTFAQNDASLIEDEVKRLMEWLQDCQSRVLNRY